MNDSEQLRLIANPSLLANINNNTILSIDNFHTKLHKLLISEYNQIYISPQMTQKIEKYIHQEINQMMIQRIIKK